jgi:hypothetical protein
MDSLNLGEIEKLRNDLQCREGLLIDFDYGLMLADLEAIRTQKNTETACQGEQANNSLDARTVSFSELDDSSGCLETV